jgi:AcrR family transcriptional regulator
VFILNGKSMPKIVDHKAYRQDLAQRAIPLFSKYGYHGLSTRKIAEELAISKSGLYHYFPTKADLFEASTVMLANGMHEQKKKLEKLLVSPSIAQRLVLLRDVNEQIAAGFSNEMSLLFDYLRDRSANEIKNDKSMQLANASYRDLFVVIVGVDLADAVLSMILGNLLRCYFLGEEGDFSKIETEISILLNT